MVLSWTLDETYDDDSTFKRIPPPLYFLYQAASVWPPRPAASPRRSALLAAAATAQFLFLSGSMVRQFSIDLVVPLSAEECWRAHRDFEFSVYSAGQDGQTVELMDELLSVDAAGHTTTERVFKMVFLIDPIPNALRPIVSKENVQPIMTETWQPSHRRVV